MTQKQLILEYIKEFGKITPAKMSGKIYKGVMLGSESTKRCREMRKAGILYGIKGIKFTTFYLKGQRPITFNKEKKLEKLQKPLFNFKKQY